METISKQAILDKTHYGLNIYSHILRLYYPDEIVMRLVGRDCGLCRNPFNANKNTLHIFIEKENVLGNAFDKEFARHCDSENAISAGDAFGFAELHYKQQGEELLQTLNKELHLRIGEEKGFYTNNRPRVIVGYDPQLQKNALSKSPPVGDLGGCLFSFFKAPISNTKPHKAVSLLQIYNAIKGDYYKDRTEKLRAISDVVQARKFKATNFNYCTFSGTFESRNDKALIKHSGLLCVDFDHLNSVETLFNRLLQDDYFDTQLLFRSPSGDGLKWIIPQSPLVGDLGGYTHGDFFAAVANYILQTYGVAVDKSGRDISRACFLPHDQQAFINPLIR
ncbi:hypothetical protein FACS1894180_5220 [Bacteroidia bacterium]|nr:hypothetical protein FACS1894180_5220 [Bacteroidia bacterium]